MQGIAGVSRFRRPLALVLTVATVITVLSARVRPATGAPTGKPNIVLILADDFDWSLMTWVDPSTGRSAMPNLQSLLVSKGMTFDNYFVTDSLCCPSRTSLLRGQFPHNTGIYTNGGSDGGFGTFYRSGEEATTIGTTLQGAGYATSLMGKYLNEYLQPGSPAPPNYVPPGWTEWDGIGYGYDEYNYDMNRNGVTVHYGSAASDYGVDVLSKAGQRYIATQVAAAKPFFLELAPFAPHAPYTPAPRHANDFPGATAPRPPSFNVLPANPPSWLAPHAVLTADDVARLDADFRLRLQAVAGVDDMIGSVVAKLQALHVLSNTYVVFTSDNGYHLGEHRMFEGKQTAFDSDIHVPLVVRGPNIPMATHASAMVQNVDLAPTFDALATAPTPGFVDGHSLVPILQTGQTPAGWRDAVLIEHHEKQQKAAVDPDVQLDLAMHEHAGASRTPPPNEMPLTYEALRTASALYVEYTNGEGEYYDYGSDPFELNNTFGSLDPALRAQLAAELAGFETCAAALCA